MIKKYDKKEDILNLRFNDNKINISDRQDNVIIDYDVNGHIVSIEILDISKIIKK